MSVHFKDKRARHNIRTGMRKNLTS